MSTTTVDLRPTINSLGLAIRDQGSRPTCSVFAMVFLLEYMYCTRLALLEDDLSEEYLNYASNQVMGVDKDGGFFWQLDDGYQEYGIVPERSVGYEKSQVTTLRPVFVTRGKAWKRLAANFIKPWDSSSGATDKQIQRTIAHLDQNIPVAIGAWWIEDSSTSWGTSVVSGVEVLDVPPTSEKGADLQDGHSVVLVGYCRDSPFDGGGYFIFRNCKGTSYGDAGYGYMPYEYVSRYANDLVAYRMP